MGFAREFEQEKTEKTETPPFPLFAPVKPPFGSCSAGLESDDLSQLERDHRPGYSLIESGGFSVLSMCFRAVNCLSSIVFRAAVKHVGL